MAICTNRSFDRWARKQGISASVLSQAVRETTAGLYVFGCPKNERSDIDKDEEALKKLAAHLLSLTPQALGKAQQADELRG